MNLTHRSMITPGNILMAPTRKYTAGDVVYCNILNIASDDWEVAVEGGRLLDLQNQLSSWPNVLGVIMEDRPTLKVVKIYVIALNRCIRSSYAHLLTLEETHEHYKK